MKKLTREKALELSRRLAYRITEASKECDMPLSDPENFRKDLSSLFFKDLENLGGIEEPLSLEEELKGTASAMLIFEPKKEEPLSLEEELKGTASAIQYLNLSQVKRKESKSFQISEKEGTTNESFR